MCSYEQRRVAIELCCQYDGQVAAAVRALGYPSVKQLKRWSSQPLMDTCLGMLSSSLKFIWTNPTEMLVSTGSVVEHIDVV